MTENKPIGTRPAQTRPAVSRTGIGQAPAAQQRRPAQTGTVGTRPLNPAQAGTRPMRPQGSRTPTAGQAMRTSAPLATQRRVVPQGARPATGVTRPMATHSRQTGGQRPIRPTNSVELFSNPKSLAIIVVIALISGLLLGGMLFGSKSSPAPQGLLGVVKNTDIRQPLRRCGMIDMGQACVLYIVNHTRYDKTVEDYFKQAEDLTGVPIYSIQMANPKYAKRIIRPGHFAEILIPRLR